MERRSLLKWLASFTTGVMLSTSTDTQETTANSQSDYAARSGKADHLDQLLPQRILRRTRAIESRMC